MPNVTNAYDAGMNLSTTMQRDPIDIGRRPNFFGDLWKMRALMPGTQPVAAAPAPPAHTPLGAVQLPPSQSFGPQQQQRSAPAQGRALAQPQYATYTRGVSALSRNQGIGAVNAAGPQNERVAEGTPGASFSGYSSTPFDPSLIDGKGPDVFQAGRGGSTPSPVRGNDPSLAPPPNEGTGQDFSKRMLEAALTRSNSQWGERNPGLLKGQ